MLPSYVPFEDWRAAFVDGRQLARIIFAEMESLSGVSRFMWCGERGDVTIYRRHGASVIPPTRLKDRDLLSYVGCAVD